MKQVQFCHSELITIVLYVINNPIFRRKAVLSAAILRTMVEKRKAGVNTICSQ